MTRRLALARSRRSPAERCRRKFLRFFPDGFRDETYLDWERDYKWSAHERWQASLDRKRFRALLFAGAFREIADTAARIEGKTNLLFSFEKMALRDAIKQPVGAEGFARALFDLLHGNGSLSARFERWVATVESLPRRQTRVLTWPLVTVFPFIAQPDIHIFLKPNVTRRAAAAYDFDFAYVSRPNWDTYENLLDFADAIRSDLADLRPRDMIDVQSFVWVQGSDEYE